MNTSKKFTPITILLIEDNPAQEGIKAKDLKYRGSDIGSLDDNIDVPGINFKKKGNKELHNLFILKVLQHPEEIKEFISNCLEKEDKEGSVALGGVAGIVPEIVVFDYKLYNNIEINSESDDQGEVKRHIKYWSSFQKLREHYNPNFLFNKEQHLEKKENENYTVKDFIERINKDQNITGNEAWYKLDEKRLKEDDLGLYAGVEITRLFRNHASIGIPATSNKENIKNLHTFSKFYEWVNDYDLGTMFSREERGNKDWDSVITAAVKQLRIRIETQLKSYKITLNLTQILAWSNEHPTEQEKQIINERNFTFQSAYGVRNLSLDGLFIDVEADKRDVAIKLWVNGLLKNIKGDSYATAKDASTKLIEAYQAVPVIRNRVSLSELAVKLCNNETLSSKDNKNLQDLLVEFGIGKPQITNCINNMKADGDNLTNKVVEYREVKAGTNEENRLIILFTDLQLHKVWQNFCKMNENALLDGQISAFLKSPPTLDDLRAALFPIPKNPLVLPYHYHLLNDKNKFKSKDPFDVWDKHLGRDMDNDKGIFYKSEYPKNLTNGEKQLALSFSLDIGLEIKYQPSWLKN